MWTPPPISDTTRQILMWSSGAAFLSLLFQGSELNWKVAVTAIFSGMFCAYLGTDIIAHLFKLDAGYYGLIGSFIGFGAMTFLAGLANLLRKWRDDPLGFIESFVPWLRSKNRRD